MEKSIINMKKLILSILIGLLLLSPIIMAGNPHHQPPDNSKPNNERAPWTKLPGLDDYAPNGLPDFDQRQDNSWKKIFDFIIFEIKAWCWCNQVASADILWYLDSKYENGHMGDGVSLCDLVPKYYDWYDKNNTHHVVSFGDDHTSGVPHALIESLAYYSNFGTDAESTETGLNNWINAQSLSNDFEVVHIEEPTFSQIQNAIDNEWGIIIRGEGEYPIINTTIPHFIAVQGYREDPTNQLLICDPFWDGAIDLKVADDPEEHNDASCVVYESRNITEITHWKANCKLENMVWKYTQFFPKPEGYLVDGYITDAVIVREK